MSQAAPTLTFDNAPLDSDLTRQLRATKESEEKLLQDLRAQTKEVLLPFPSPEKLQEFLESQNVEQLHAYLLQQREKEEKLLQQLQSKMKKRVFLPLYFSYYADSGDEGKMYSSHKRFQADEDKFDWNWLAEKCTFLSKGKFFQMGSTVEEVSDIVHLHSYYKYQIHGAYAVEIDIDGACFFEKPVSEKDLQPNVLSAQSKVYWTLKPNYVFSPQMIKSVQWSFDDLQREKLCMKFVNNHL